MYTYLYIHTHIYNFSEYLQASSSFPLNDEITQSTDY